MDLTEFLEYSNLPEIRSHECKKRVLTIKKQEKVDGWISQEVNLQDGGRGYLNNLMSGISRLSILASTIRSEPI